MQPERPKRRHLNAGRKRALRTAELQQFARQYGRPVQKNTEPNDRNYDRDIERMIRRMEPEQLDRLLHDDDD